MRKLPETQRPGGAVPGVKPPPPPAPPPPGPPAWHGRDGLVVTVPYPRPGHVTLVFVERHAGGHLYGTVVVSAEGLAACEGSADLSAMLARTLAQALARARAQHGGGGE